MLKANYHTHTSRCGHATGKDEDYVLEAIGAGFDELGFSDHIMLPGFSQPGVRGEYNLCDDYLSSIASLKEKYKERIKIKIGFEAEYFEEYLPYYRGLLDSGRIDYLVLGNHFKMVSGTIVGNYGGTTKKEAALAYRDLSLAAINSGLFLIFAHPDTYLSYYEEFDATAKLVATDIIEAAIAHKMPLEVNLAGIRNGLKLIGKVERYIYPHDEFWKLASKLGATVVLGVDAHNPEDFSSDASDIAVRFVRKYQLNVVDYLDFERSK